MSWLGSTTAHINHHTCIQVTLVTLSHSATIPMETFSLFFNNIQFFEETVEVAEEEMKFISNVASNSLEVKH